MAKFNWNQFEKNLHDSEHDEDAGMSHDDFMDCMGNKCEKSAHLERPIQIHYEIDGVHIEISLPNVSARELMHRLVKIAKFINEAEAEYYKLIK